MLCIGYTFNISIVISKSNPLLSKGKAHYIHSQIRVKPYFAWFSGRQKCPDIPRDTFENQPHFSV